jgi:hypothetical protein
MLQHDRAIHQRVGGTIGGETNQLRETKVITSLKGGRVHKRSVSDGGVFNNLVQKTIESKASAYPKTKGSMAKVKPIKGVFKPSTS